MSRDVPQAAPPVGDRRELTIEIGARCPLRCRFCSNHREERGLIGYDRLTDLLAEAGGLDLDVNLSGGDVLRDVAPFQDAFDLVGGDRTRIYTSGVAPAGWTVEDWRKLAPAAAVVFNVQSVDAAVHDDLGGDWAATRASLALALEAGLRVEAHLVPMRPNLATLDLTARWLVRLGVVRVALLRLVVQGEAERHRADLELDPQERQRLQCLIDTLQADPEVGPKLRVGVPLGGPGTCRAGRGRLLVRADGEVAPCEAFKHRVSLGAAGADSLEDLFEAGRQWADRWIPEVSPEVARERAEWRQPGDPDPCPAQAAIARPGSPAGDGPE
jgi:MoaA/NifB/PqqE/SkfB family radical SAM enzyme